MKPLEINYKTIVLLEKDHVHKVHKRKEIQKNSCKMTQRVVVLTLEENKESMTPYMIDFLVIEDTND